MRLPDGYLDTTISGLGGLIGSRHEQVVLTPPGNRNRVPIEPVADERVANRRRTGERQRLIVGEIAKRIGETDHFDFVNRTLLYIIEHSPIGDLGFGGQLVASENEVEAKVMREDWLRRDRMPENHIDILPAFLDPRGAPGARFCGRVRLLEGRRRLALLDGNGSDAAVSGIRQYDKQSLPGAACEEDHRAEGQNCPAHYRCSP